MRSRLDAPAGCDARSIVRSHGWYLLAPFAYDPETATLATTVDLGDSGVFPIRLTFAAAGVALAVPGRPGAATSREIERRASRIVGFDLDLGIFHDAVASHEPFRWMARRRVGRLLRAPSAWEDLVKLVLTTNCSWALTERMAARLTERWGRLAPDGTRAFPSPEAIATAGERALREDGKVGYRAPHLARLADGVAGGEWILDGFPDDPEPAESLRARLLALPGVGPYVAENFLKLVARPCGPALDSWLRAAYARRYHAGRRVTDRTIVRRYARLGDHAGLALWFDLTRGGAVGKLPTEESP